MHNKKENASEYPSFYYAKHITGGLVGYEDETLFVNDATLKEMMPSFIGKPVVVLHQPIELFNLEQKDGTIVESFYNELDGRFWVKFLIETDKGREAIMKGHSVSNCYQPTQFGESGTHNNIEYHRSMLKGYYKHLAIVPNPRYEEAKIYTPDEFKNYQEKERKKLTELQNSMENKKMFKFFKNEKKEVSQIDEDTMLTLENGSDVSVKEMIAAIVNAKKNEDEKEKGDKEAKKEEKAEEEKVNMDTEVSVGDSKMPIRELVNKYNTMMKKNAEKGTGKDEDEKTEEDMQNKQKKNDNGKDKDHFNELLNASGSANSERIETSSDRLRRGQQRYGSGNK